MDLPWIPSAHFLLSCWPPLHRDPLAPWFPFRSCSVLTPGAESAPGSRYRLDPAATVGDRHVTDTLTYEGGLFQLDGIQFAVGG